MAVTYLLAAIVSTVTAFASCKLLIFLIKPQLSPLRELRGPKNESFLLGNLRSVYKEDSLGTYARWEEAYGPVFVIKAFVNVCVFSSGTYFVLLITVN